MHTQPHTSGGKSGVKTPLRTEPLEAKSLQRPHKSSEEMGQGCLSPECWFCETHGSLGFCRPP